MARSSRWQEWTALDARVWRMAFARAVNTMGLSLAMTFLGIYVVETRGYPAWLYGVVAILVITSSEVMFSPAHQTSIAEVSDPAHRGRTYGVVGFSQMAGVAVAPLVGGILFDTIGDHHVAMWALIASIGILQAICFAAFVRRVSSRG